jgi:hypothetical protein
MQRVLMRTNFGPPPCTRYFCIVRGARPRNRPAPFSSTNGEGSPPPTVVADTISVLANGWNTELHRRSRASTLVLPLEISTVTASFQEAFAPRTFRERR